MKAESLWIRVERQRTDVVEIVFLVTRCKRVVDTRLRELATLNKDVRVDVAFKNSLDEANILFLCDSTTVVDLGTEHVQNLEGYIIVSLNEFLELPTANNKIFVGKGVRDIPANGTKLAAVLHDSMEEAEAKEKLLVYLRLGAFLKLFRSERVISLQNISLEARRRLKSHLHRVL